MAMKLEHSHERGFRYCSKCDTDFSYCPINKEHLGHKVHVIDELELLEHCYCFRCKTSFFDAINTKHHGHKTYALVVEQSTEPGYRYCSTCDTDFYHPINKEHQDHKTYKTRQGLFLNLKLQVLRATQEIEDMLEKLTIQEHTAHSITTPLQTLKQRAETLIEQHQTVPQFYRIASWNLKKLSDNTKRSLLYEQRLQSICKTILYYQFDIVALQEVCTETTAKLLVESLNENSDLIWKYLHIVSIREVPTILYNNYISEAWKNTEWKEKKAVKKYQKAPFCCTFETYTTRKKIVLISTHITCVNTEQQQEELRQLPNLLSLHDSMSHVIL